MLTNNAQDGYNILKDIKRLASEINAKLVSSGQTLALAESLTGGLVADAIVQIPGASKFFKGSIVAYLDEVKARVLGVKSVDLIEKGAVHPDVAWQMATGVKGLLGADCVVATTGFAGGAQVETQFSLQTSPPEEVGLTYIAVITPSKSIVQEFRFCQDEPKTRFQIRYLAVLEALKILNTWI